MARYQQKDDVSIDGLLAMIEAAAEELNALCYGKRFRMSIPVDSEDSDMVIGDALRHARAFVNAVKSNNESEVMNMDEKNEVEQPTSDQADGATQEPVTENEPTEQPEEAKE